MKKLYFLLLLLCSGMVLADPPITPPTPLSVCEDVNQGFALVNLTQKDAEILNVLNPNDYSVVYYTQFAQANAGSGGEIAAPMQFTVSTSIVIFVRVTELVNPSNFAVKPLEIVMYALPSTAAIPDLEFSQEPFIGTASFNLTLRGQQTGCTTSYFETLFDAQSNANPILNPTNFQNLTNPQTIYIVVANNNSGCFSINQFIIRVVPNSGTVNIPDLAFKNSLIAQGFDTNSDGEIQFSEALVPTNISSYQANISDLTGIEAFTNVESLNVSNNQLTAINVSALTNLKVLSCNSNQLTALNLVGLTNLQGLDCQNNQLTSLNANGFSDLVVLNCFDNQLTNLTMAGANSLKSIQCANNLLTALNVTGFSNLEALNCYNNQITALNITGLIGLKGLNCSTNQIPTLDFTGMVNLLGIYCNNNQLTSINLNGLTNLVNLHCQNNLITSFALNGLPNLIDVKCFNNQIPALNITNSPNIQYLNCSENQLTALNAAVFAELVQLECQQNQITTLDVNGLGNLTLLNCSFNSLNTLEMSGLTSLQSLSCNDNAITSVILSGLTTLQTIDCSNNLLSVLDFSGFTVLNFVLCNNNQLTSLTLNPDLITLNCSNNQLTTIDASGLPNLTLLECADNQLTTLFIKNGQAEQVTLSNNPNLGFICADDVQIAALLTQAGPSVTVNSYCTFEPGGDYNAITGTVKYDANNNGCDNLDLTFPYIKVGINDGTLSGDAYTNTFGQYTFYTGAGDFLLAPDLENPSYFNLVLPASVNFPAVDNSLSTQNFCITPNGIHKDLEVVIAPIVPARPGFDAVYKIVYKNKGNQTMSQQYGVTFSYNANLMNFLSANPAVETQNAGTLAWSFTNLMPFESRSILVTMHVNAPSDANPVNVNDVLTLTSIISPQGGDETVGDNIFIFNQLVVGSFDPNDITCIEGDVVSPNEIGNYLHYIINFENTGTDQAENIVVKNLIDESQFDLSSLRIMNASHNVDARVSGNKAEFIFKDINLEIGGHGNILLKIKSKTDLISGDIVTNKADIFFDYNLPVATNFANTVFQALGLNNHNTDASIAIYPNPTQDILNIKAKGNIKSVQLFDIQGRILQTSVINETATAIDISGKQSGIYFLKVTSDTGIKVEKIVKK